MATLTEQDALVRAREVAEKVTDPELPMMTLKDLGVLRSVTLEGESQQTVVATITPTYSGCPAMATMRDDLVHALRDNGFDRVRVQVSLEPAWTTDWISTQGRDALSSAGISAPGAVDRTDGPVPLTLLPRRRNLVCPRCGSTEVAVTSEFGSTACKALYRCETCLEPFEHIKEI
jgi:ring-1,2-phenylacetyl-CoA epoxidase subunit PaaD